MYMYSYVFVCIYNYIYAYICIYILEGCKHVDDKYTSKCVCVRVRTRQFEGKKHMHTKNNKTIKKIKKTETDPVQYKRIHVHTRV